LRIRHIEIRNFRGIKSLCWWVKGDFNCIIGPGDTCKTTILTALDYALSPRTTLSFDDSDFFNQDIDQDIVIQVTLAGWDDARPDIRKFFQERKFAQYKCGLDHTGPLPEPPSEDRIAVSVSLRVDKSLEPKWFVVRGRDEGEGQDRQPIYAADRAVLGLSRLDIFSDFHFTWGRNTILTRLSADSQGNLSAVVSELARGMRQSDISDYEGIAECQAVADTVKQESRNAGVRLTALSPKIDIQRQSMSAGALSLHEANVPLRNKGSGSKKLIAAAMQMKLHGGKNIGLIDEIELGLEPHRIRGLIYRLKNAGQQIFTTTHSPVVIRELNVADDELYVCKRDAAGAVSLENLAIVSDIQGPVRANAEAFLGSRIIACEGSTEIGCLRAYDIYRFDKSSAPVWSLATSYFNCGTASRIARDCPQLVRLGYRTAALCDNDATDQLSTENVESLRALGVHVCQWETGNSTERQLFYDLPWAHVPTLLETISANHDTLELATIIDRIRKDARVVAQNLGADPVTWPESRLLREVMGDLAHRGNWIKRIDYAEAAFRFALPLFPDTTVLKSRINALWSWIQEDER
jgi:energy-coupling factor transporter ATP-binding protein EcfA2